MCGKIPFGSRGEAKAWARQVKRSGRGDLRPYLCRDCPAWHLTASYSARDSRRIDKRNGRR
jgi:hypothetical protein